MSDPKFEATKDPNDVLDYTINWASPGGTNNGTPNDRGWLQGDTIVTSVWIVDTGITVDSSSNTDTSVTVWLSGGTVIRNKCYNVTNRITTVGGRTKDRTIFLEVKEA